MLVLPKQKKIFVHIPRTSGNRLCESIMEVCPEAVRLRGPETHMPIWKVREVFPGYEMFTIYRDPIPIFLSHYDFCTWIVENKNIVPYALYKYATICGYKDINSNISYCISNSVLCKFGGFRSTYIDEDTTVFPYIEGVYKQISKYLDIPFSMKEKEYTYIKSKEEQLNADIKRAIKMFCWRDYVYMERYM